MGIPKFFRYIAQRWPLSSQQVNDNVIPEFDNLYLDMNSILHTSTHNNAENVGHISEDQMYTAICNYIEHLFAVITPKKVFFMAIDGVAPRAKMNQQRARRFRSAMDAENARRKAASRGEVLDEDPFDSNCITPGTEFMARLTQRLRYFIARKITEDTRWQECTIILSGHEVPGEGEHKIMKFIRSLRSQPGYSPNTRHCLFGLDADLIMLGLSTHEPHFALLREEVSYGRQIRFQSSELSEQRFMLLHLALVREYIQIELSGPDNPTADFERMLDDFVLIFFFIGNDFLPELPMLMINDGAIPVILDTYKAYLRQSGNKYLGKNGVIDFLALKHWMEHLKVYQVQKFEETSQDLSWYNARLDDVESPDSEEIVLSLPQRALFDEIAPVLLRMLRAGTVDAEYTITTTEQQFLSLLATQTGFEYANGVLRYQAAVEPKLARKIIRQYDHARVNDPSKKLEYAQRFTEWKNRYYQSKFKDTLDSETVQKTAEKYLEGLQWVLLYYYHGCPSWSWYYDNHYAPMTTEIITAIGEGYSPKFDVGTPFLPFEQLMAVLPDRSVKLLPPALRPLVLEPTSPIIDFYPHEFALDQNGKKADWEAVVLIPFIDQDRLLKVVKPVETKGLTPEEMQRNSRGAEYEFSFDPNAASLYKSPTPSLPDIPASTCVVKVLSFPTQEVKYGLLKGARKGVNALAGFPSLYMLPFDWEIEAGKGVKVFEMPSRDKSVIVYVKPAQHGVSVGDRVFVNWPFLTEAKVTAVLAREASASWTRDLPRLSEDYQRRGVQIGETEALVRVGELQGLRRQEDGSYRKEFGGAEHVVPVQLIVPNVESEDPRFAERDAKPIEDEFPLNSNVLLLVAKYFGCPATVMSYQDGLVDVEVFVPSYRDPLFAIARGIAENERTHIRWSSLEQVAKSLAVPVKFLLQLTSRYVVEAGGETFNIALSLRKHGLGLMAEGYSRLGYRGQWEFSDRGVAILLAYLREFREPFNSLRGTSRGISAEVAKTMRDWVRKHSDSIAFVPTTTNHLTQQSVAALEQKVIQLPATHIEKVLVKGIDGGALLSPSHAHHQLRRQNFKLGDRVVSALSFGKVPLYMRGVVVGVNGGGSAASTTLDVLWDHEFEAGSTLDGRATTKRGLIVSADSVLNLSYAQLTFNQASPREDGFINARAITRRTPANGGQGEKSRPQARKFVPAAPRNDWAAAKQVKTNASGLHLLQALGRDEPQTVPPPSNAPVAAAPAPTASASGNRPEKSGEETPRKSARGPKKPSLKAKGSESSSSSVQAEAPRSGTATKFDSKPRPSRGPKDPKDSKGFKGQSTRNSKVQKGAAKQEDSKLERPEKTQKPGKSNRSDEKPPTEGATPSEAPTHLVLPEVKNNKPRNAESAKTLLDALLLKN